MKVIWEAEDIKAGLNVVTADAPVEPWVIGKATTGQYLIMCLPTGGVILHGPVEELLMFLNERGFVPEYFVRSG